MEIRKVPFPFHSIGFHHFWRIFDISRTFASCVSFFYFYCTLTRLAWTCRRSWYCAASQSLRNQGEEQKMTLGDEGRRRHREKQKARLRQEQLKSPCAVVSPSIMRRAAVWTLIWETTVCEIGCAMCGKMCDNCEWAWLRSITCCRTLSISLVKDACSVCDVWQVTN